MQMKSDRDAAEEDLVEIQVPRIPDRAPATILNLARRLANIGCFRERSPMAVANASRSRTEVAPPPPLLLPLLLGTADTVTAACALAD